MDDADEPHYDEENPADLGHVFLHPQWTVGVVLILAVVTLFLGIFGHPVWLLMGGPFILTFAVWIVVRIVQWRRPPVAEGNARVDLPTAGLEDR